MNICRIEICLNTSISSPMDQREYHIWDSDVGCHITTITVFFDTQTPILVKVSTQSTYYYFCHLTHFLIWWAHLSGQCGKLIRRADQGSNWDWFSWCVRCCIVGLPRGWELVLGAVGRSRHCRRPRRSERGRRRLTRRRGGRICQVAPGGTKGWHMLAVAKRRLPRRAPWARRRRFTRSPPAWNHAIALYFS
jgi:hypothetical protein